MNDLESGIGIGMGLAIACLALIVNMFGLNISADEVVEKKEDIVTCRQSAINGEHWFQGEGSCTFGSEYYVAMWLEPVFDTLYEKTSNNSQY